MILAAGLAIARLLAVAPAGYQDPGSPAACTVPSGSPRGSAPAATLGEPEARRRVARMSALADAARKRGQQDTVALALSLKAELLNYLGESEAALLAAEQALRDAPPGSAAELQVRLAIGETWQARGYSDSALPHYGRALVLAQPADRARQRGRACNNLGIAYHELGDVNRALRYLGRARDIRAAVGDSDGLAATLNNIGRVYTTTGRPTAALGFLDSALALRKQRHDPVGEAAALNNKGYAYDLLALPSAALAMYRQALAALERVDSRSLRGLTLLNIGRAELALGRIADAKRHFQEGKQAKEAAGDAAGVSWAYHDLGRASLALGQWRDAVAWLGKARSDMQRRGDLVREGSALYYLGSAYRAAGDSASLRRAVAAYDSAAAVRARVAGTIVDDADRVVFAEQDRHLPSQWALTWLRLRQWLPRDTVAKASLAAVERGRARALLELLRTPASAAGGGAAADAVETPTLSYLVTARALLTWLVLPSGRTEVYCQRLSRARLDTLVTGLRDLIYAPNAAGAGAPDSGATMLDDDATAAPPECADVQDHDRAADAIVRQGLDSVLTALSRLLLLPAVRAQLPDTGAGELVVVPNGALGLVPFAALPLDAAGTPLGIRHALRYAPSLALLANLGPTGSAAGRARSLAASVIVGDPAMPMDPATGAPFPPLHLAGLTARWLAGAVGAPVLTGAEATKARVVAALPQAPLVHLGTHGRAFASEAAARRSFVVLAADSAGDGLLTVADVVDSLRLTADLVVLLACQTGLGDIKDTEGTIGLQRAFLARGARSVLVSLWQVDTAATDMLIREFYRQWLEAAQPIGKAEALRRAQVKVWREWMTGRDSPEERLNPYWWAGFQLVGMR